jgi:hypothetical protein
MYMPTKKKLVQKQKQKQKQSVVVNVNVAKARAKKSGTKRVQIPPAIYASPIQNLVPQAFSKEGRQISIPTLEDQMKDFFKSQQQPKNILGEPELRSKSELIPYDVSSDRSFRSANAREFQNEVLKKLSPEEQKQQEKAKKNVEKMYQDILRKRESESNIPTPFEREERSYLKQSEPDYESAVPFYNRLEPSIYETLRRLESNVKRDEEFAKQYRN